MNSTGHGDQASGRRQPAHGVHLAREGPTVAWCTVCAAECGGNWCCTEAVRQCLHDIWATEATNWRVGHYLLMPDHIHFFAAPASRETGDIEGWTKYWKTRFAHRCSHRDWRWQRGLFHHRMRSEDLYQEQWQYLSLNPVREGLVQKPEDWPWQGKVHDVGWGLR